MTIFKLIFEHDMVLQPAGGTSNAKEASSLEDFLKPVPTYSRFYFTATDMDTQRYGLSATRHTTLLRDAFRQVIESGTSFLLSDGTTSANFDEAIDRVDEGDAMVVVTGDRQVTPFPVIGSSGSFKDHIQELTSLLDAGHRVVFKVKAHAGYDLHLFSRDNIYRDFFYAFQPLIRDDLRFFSINGKKARSERFFYFETWSLHRPPHGIEEVFPETPYY